MKKILLGFVIIGLIFSFWVVYETKVLDDETSQLNSQIDDLNSQISDEEATINSFGN